MILLCAVRRRAGALITSLLLAALTAGARDIFVDPRTGNDSASGATKDPVKTIARGLRLAGAGDTVHLAPVVFKESAVFHNRSGEPGRPIVLDGHGATLDGADDLDLAQWESVGPGLFRNEKLLRMDDAILGRWYFLIDGRMQRMGRTSKGPKDTLKKPESLQPGEWTFVTESTKTNATGKSLTGAFYLKVDPAKAAVAFRIAAPLRSNGVSLSGTNAHIVVRNVSATHVYNDGFNIHGISRDIRFENIRAVECGDDGFSAHDDCQTVTDGFVSIGNSTGICDVGNSVTDFNRVFIRDCHGFDLYFLDHNRHTVRNSRIHSSAARTLVIDGAKSTNLCSLLLENVLIRRMSGSNELRISKGSTLEARRVTWIGLGVQATGGSVRLTDSLIIGDPAPVITLWPGVEWSGDRNLFSLTQLRDGAKVYVESTFGEFQALRHQEASSKWMTVSVRDGLPTTSDETHGANIQTIRAAE